MRVASLWLALGLLCCVPSRGFGLQNPALISTGTYSGLRLFAPNSNDWWFDPLFGRLDIRVNGSATPIAAFLSGGNVGIGTTSPGSNLDVYRGDGTTGTALNVIGNTTTNDGVGVNIFLGHSSGNYGGYLRAFNGNTTNGGLVVEGKGGLNLRTSARSVVITPNQTGFFTIGDSASSAVTTQIYASGADDILRLYDSGGSRKATFTNGGNVGIGTTAPVAKLDVSGTANMTGFSLPTGAASGKVLTSDALGAGTWQAAAGGGATYVGLSASATGNMGGVSGADSLCAASYPGSHFCSTSEVKGMAIQGTSNYARINPSSQRGGAGYQEWQCGSVGFYATGIGGTSPQQCTCLNWSWGDNTYNGLQLLGLGLLVRGCGYSLPAMCCI